MRALAALAAPLALGTAAAQTGVIRAIDDTVVRLAGEGQVVAGLGAGFTSQPYRDVDDSVRSFAIPLITYQSERFEFVGKTLSAEVWKNDRIAVEALADWRFQSYDAEDSPYLAGMDDRDGTLEAGGRVKTDALGVQVALTAKADLLSRQGGWEADLQASYELSSWRPLSVRPNVGLRYQSSSLADYYYGVDPEEGRLGTVCAASTDTPCTALDPRPAYEVDGAFTPYLGIQARQALSRKVAVAGAIDYAFLPGTITDSPIVSEEGQLFGFIGVVYLFGDIADRI